MVAPNFEHKSYQKSFDDARFFLDEVWGELQTQMRAVEILTRERDLAIRLVDKAVQRQVEAVSQIERLKQELANTVPWSAFNDRMGEIAELQEEIALCQESCHCPDHMRDHL